MCPALRFDNRVSPWNFIWLIILKYKYSYFWGARLICERRKGIDITLLEPLLDKTEYINISQLKLR
jgi:hypothetical protein